MAPPTLWQHFRQTLGRALRETAQALDRLGVKTASLAVTQHDFYDDPTVYEDHLSRHRQLFPLLHSGRPWVHPQVAYIAPCATLIGSVNVDRGASIWYGAVLRGDACEHAESFYQKLPDINQKNEALSPVAGNRSIEEYSDNKNDAKELECVMETPWTLDKDRFANWLGRPGGGIFIGENTNIQDGCVITARVDHCRIGRGVTVGHLAQIHSATVHDYALIGMGSILQEGAVVEREALVAAGAVVMSHQVVPSGQLWIGNPARKLRDLSEQERAKLHYQSSEYVNVATEHQPTMQLCGNLWTDQKPVEAIDQHIAGQEQDGSSDMQELVNSPKEQLEEFKNDKPR